MFERKKVILVLALLITLLNSFSQVTRIKGIVKDAQTGEPISYASVFVKGTSIVVFTNDSGAYLLETRQRIDSITVAFLGYKTQSEQVEKNVTQIINFNLQPSIIEVKEVVVTPGVNPAHRIVENVIKNKKKNTSYKFDYQVNRYSKVQISINNIDDKFKNRKILKPFQFVFENVDTNSYTGNVYLPVILPTSSV